MFKPIRVAAIPESVTVMAGGQAAYALTIQNASSIVDRYHLAVDGVPEGWVRLNQPRMTLFPGTSAQAQVEVTPPAGTVAGDFRLVVTATSEDDPAVRAEIAMTLSVAPAGGVSLELLPAAAEGREGVFRLAVVNGMNRPARVSIEGRDSEEGLDFRYEPDADLEVPAGAERAVRARVRPRVRETIGAPHPYEVEFRATLAGATTADPRLTRQALYTYVPPITSLALPVWLRRLPGWALVLGLTALVLLLLLAGPLVSHAFTPPTHPDVPATQTAVARQMATAQAGALARLTAQAGVAATAQAQLTAVTRAQAHAQQTARAAKQAQASDRARPTPQGHQEHGPAPVIKFFTVRFGPHQTILSWAVLHARHVHIDGHTVAVRGQRRVTIAAPVSFTLVARGPGGKAVQVLRVVPLPGGIRHIAPPIIERFVPTFDLRTAKATLTWQVRGARSVAINGVRVAARGSESIDPRAQATYVLTGTNAGGTATAIVVLPTPTGPEPGSGPHQYTPQPPIITQFALVHDRGDRSYRLVWRTSDATSVTLDGQPVSANGDRALPSPLRSELYRLVARNGAGGVTAQVQITIPIGVGRTGKYTLAPPIIVLFRLRYAGGHVTVVWRVDHAGRISIGGRAVRSSGEEPVARGTTDLRLTAQNDVGTVQSDLQLTWPPSPGKETATATPTAASTGVPTPVPTATSPPAPTATSTPAPLPAATQPPATSGAIATPAPTDATGPLPTATQTGAETAPSPAAPATPSPSPVVNGHKNKWTPTPVPTATRTPMPTATRPPRPALTPAVTATSTPTRRPLPTKTPRPGATRVPTRTATATTTPRSGSEGPVLGSPTADTSTPTPTAAAAQKVTDTATPTPIDTATPTETAIPTDTATPIPTSTATATPTATPTDTATPTAVPPPHLSLRPASLDFGDQAVGRTSAPQTITVRNDGSAPIAIASALGGDYPAEYSIASTTCDGAPLPAGETCQIAVVFHPRATGSRPAVITVIGNLTVGDVSALSGARGLPPSATTTAGSATISGVGAVPHIHLSSARLSFGDQALGTASIAQEIVVTDTGSVPLRVSSVAINGMDAADFVANSTCTVAALSPGHSCAVTVTFAPTAVGARDASLVLTDDAPDTPQLVDLSGTGTRGTLTFSPPTLDFGAQRIDTAGATRAITVTDTGSAPVSIAHLALDNPFQFTERDTCAGTTLAPMDACRIDLTFSPTRTGPITGALYLYDDAQGNPQTASLSGIGVDPRAFLAPNPLRFEDQPIATRSAPLTATLTNVGTTPLTVRDVLPSDPMNYQEANSCTKRVLTPGASCLIVVSFTPSITGSVSGRVLVYDDAPDSPQVLDLAGAGIDARAALSPASLDFGDAVVGTVAATRTVTVTNTGSTPLDVADITVTGAAKMDFAADGACRAQSLAPGAACSIAVSFAPTGTGTRAAALTIADNAADSPQDVPLTGVGYATRVRVTPSTLDLPYPCADGNDGPSPGPPCLAEPVTITNLGPGTLIVSRWSISGAQAADFAVAGSTCSDRPIGPRQSCVISATLAITDVATAYDGGRLGGAGTLVIVDNALDAAGNHPQSVDLAWPVVLATPAHVDFGDVPIGGTSATQVVTVTNVSGAPVTVAAARTSDDRLFRTSADRCSGVTLAPTDNCTIDVEYDASETAGPGPALGTLSIYNSSDDSPKIVALSGTTTVPVVPSLPCTLDFGQQQVGTQSPSQTCTLTNTGNAPLQVSAIDLGDERDYGETDTCVGVTVAPAGSCTIGVTFAPATAGIHDTSLTIADNAANSPQTIALTGTGFQPAARFYRLLDDGGPRFLPSGALAFGSQVDGSVSATRTLYLVNNGPGALTLPGNAISVDNGFAVERDDCSGKVLPAALDPGDTTALPDPRYSCAIDLAFQPQSGQVGPVTATLQVVDNAGNAPQQAILSGSAVATGIDLSPATLVFPYPCSAVVAAAASVIPCGTQAVTVTNTGPGDLSIGAIRLGNGAGSDFLDTSTCPIAPATLPARASCTITVALNLDNIRGSGQGGGTDWLFVEDNALGATGPYGLQSVQLAWPASAVQATPNTIDFGSQAVGTRSATQTVTVSNATENALTVTGVTVDDPEDYSIGDTCVGRVLAPQATCTIEAGFAPSAAGAHSAAILLTDSADPSAQPLIALTGTGTQPAAIISDRLEENNGGVAPGPPVSAEDYGVQEVGASAEITRTFYVWSSGSGALTIPPGAVTIVGDPSFTAADDTCSGASLAPGSYCSVDVVFQPASPGSHSASLRVGDNAQDSPQTVTLTGVGATPNWYADSTNGDDSQDCRSWQTACRTIGAAVGKAASGATIMLAAGLYRERPVIEKDLTIVGMGATQPSPTVIDGGRDGTTLTIRRADSSPSPRVVVSGVVIQGGNGLAGGGGPGGIENDGVLTLSDSAVSTNIGGFTAGGIENRGTLTLNSVTISANRGAVAGGIENDGAMAIADSTVSGNDTASSGTYAAGIYNAAGATLLINRSTISGNNVSEGGYAGGILNDGKAFLVDSTVSGNERAGIYNSGQDPTAGLSGIGMLTIKSSTISDNAGIGLMNTSRVGVSIANTILTGNTNTPKAAATYACLGTVWSLGYNLVREDADGRCRFARLDSDIVLTSADDPGLGPLADNGGPSDTQALLPTSPAIDRGDPGGCTDAQGVILTIDQRGAPRAADGGSGTNRCDIGAYEYRSTPPGGAS